MCAKFLLLFETAKVVTVSTQKRLCCKTSSAQFENLSISCGREKRRFKNSTDLLEKRSQSKHNCICDGKNSFPLKTQKRNIWKVHVCIYIYTCYTIYRRSCHFIAKNSFILYVVILIQFILYYILLFIVCYIILHYIVLHYYYLLYYFSLWNEMILHFIFHNIYYKCVLLLSEMLWYYFFTLYVQIMCYKHIYIMVDCKHS